MSNNLCWDCRNACGGCSWSESLTPVEGWTAKATKIKSGDGKKGRHVDTYHIEACPEYKPDEKYIAECEKRRGRPDAFTEAERALVRAMRKQGHKYREIAAATKLSMMQIGVILKDAGMTDAARRVSLERRAEIIRLREQGYSQQKVQDITGVSKATIRKIERE